MEGKEEGLNIIVPPKIIIMNKISCLTSIINIMYSWYDNGSFAFGHL